MVQYVNTLLAAMLVGSTFGTAIPKPNTMSTGRASLKTAKRANHKFNGPLSVYKTHMKFKAPIPDSLYEAVLNSTGIDYRKINKRTEGEAAADPSDTYDDSYLTPVSIGTPAQVLNLDFDTGSSDLWVFSSLTAAADIDGQSIYTPSASSTSKLVSGATWSISYGDGSSSSGTVYDDVVNIGGVSVAAQAVEVAKKVSSEFTADTTTDGLVGLGFKALNTVSPTAQNTFIGNAMAALDSPVFTADLKHQADGTYDFGYVDAAKHTSAITFTAIDTSPGYWTWTSTGYGVGTTYTTKSIVGIADTGTTLLYLPLAIVEAYYAQVAGGANSIVEGGYIFNCDAADDLPDFVFGVGTSKITVPGSYINYGPVTSTGIKCFGGLQSSASIGINIFGDVALKSAFVVFNPSVPSIGWATKTLT